jgi:hypothetical protein
MVAIGRHRRAEGRRRRRRVRRAIFGCVGENVQSETYLTTSKASSEGKVARKLTNQQKSFFGMFIAPKCSCRASKACTFIFVV